MHVIVIKKQNYVLSPFALGNLVYTRIKV